MGNQALVSTQYSDQNEAEKHSLKWQLQRRTVSHIEQLLFANSRNGTKASDERILRYKVTSKFVVLLSISLIVYLFFWPLEECRERDGRVPPPG